MARVQTKLYVDGCAEKYKAITNDGWMQKLKVIMHMNTSAMKSTRCVCTYILNECTTTVGSQNYALRLTE